MVSINKADSVKETEGGMVIKCGEQEIFLAWAVIDVIAEESEAHYFGSAVEEIAIMNSQTKLN